MTVKQKQLKRRLVMSVHVSPLYKEIYKDDRDLYEEMMQNHFGKKSSKELDIEQLMALADFLNKRVDHLARIIRSGSASIAQTRLIEKLWAKIARDKSESALRGFIYRISNKNYLKVESISKEDAVKVIIALKKMEKDI